MKLVNFQYLDSAADGGLDAYGKRDAEIWDEFANRPQELDAAARAVWEQALKGKSD